jgi:hypothetical protein
VRVPEGANAASEAADQIVDLKLDAENLTEVLGKGLTGATTDATAVWKNSKALITN